MKTIYTLTNFQAETLKKIQNKISCDVSLAREKVIKLGDCDDIIEILDRIEALTNDMENILVSE